MRHFHWRQVGESPDFADELRTGPHGERKNSGSKRSDKNDLALLPDSDRAGSGRDRVERDFEARRQLDLAEIAPQELRLFDLRGDGLYRRCDWRRGPDQ
ncbi:hypothetical protein [Methylocella sp.]|jgi:hypothetical protein|uniref:hypothetical protein n=1 Tax=Methylocella sp. TaxID=1978226 RepID=UPI003C2096D1